MENGDRTRRATDDNVMLRIRTAWWITKVTNTHSECVILVAFLRVLVTRTRLIVTFVSTLPVLFTICGHIKHHDRPLPYDLLTCCFLFLPAFFLKFPFSRLVILSLRLFVIITMS